jgi:hypothetical protein
MMNMEDEHGKRIINRLTVGEEPRKKLRKPTNGAITTVRPGPTRRRDGQTAEGRTLAPSPCRTGYPALRTPLT